MHERSREGRWKTVTAGRPPPETWENHTYEPLITCVAVAVVLQVYAEHGLYASCGQHASHHIAVGGDVCAHTHVQVGRVQWCRTLSGYVREPTWLCQPGPPVTLIRTNAGGTVALQHAHHRIDGVRGRSYQCGDLLSRQVLAIGRVCRVGDFIHELLDTVHVRLLQLQVLHRSPEPSVRRQWHTHVAHTRAAGHVRQ